MLKNVKNLSGMEFDFLCSQEDKCYQTSVMPSQGADFSLPTIYTKLRVCYLLPDQQILFSVETSRTLLLVISSKKLDYGQAIKPTISQNEKRLTAKKLGDNAC